MPGNTRTGGVLEAMILPALDRGGYQHREQVAIGDRLGCGRHVVDAIAEKNGRQFLVSVKWQQVAGTAEQKVPFEVICLLDAIEHGPYTKAYLVLGGEGWKLRNFYVSGGLDRFLASADSVEIITLEGFVAMANSGRLQVAWRRRSRTKPSVSGSRLNSSEIIFAKTRRSRWRILQRKLDGHQKQLQRICRSTSNRSQSRFHRF
jgi:hypothetical protein